MVEEISETTLGLLKPDFFRHERKSSTKISELSQDKTFDKIVKDAILEISEKDTEKLKERQAIEKGFVNDFMGLKRRLSFIQTDVNDENINPNQTKHAKKKSAPSQALK